MQASTILNGALGGLFGPEYELEGDLIANIKQIKVGLFVDWNSHLRLAPKELKDDAILRSRYAINLVGKAVTRELCKFDSNATFRVRMRLYYGWTSGVTRTPNRKAVAELPEYDNPDQIFPSSRVLSLADIEFGDRLIDAMPERENIGLGIHLPNTWRKQSGRSEKNEKMVDTALAADLLSWARAEPNSMAVVASADDDVIPPIFVAEAWMRPFGGSVRVLRPSPRVESKFLRLEGLLN